MADPVNLHPAARHVLELPDPEAKAQATLDLWDAWQAGACVRIPFSEGACLSEPGRPEKPRLAPPQAMPRRELSGPAGHAALIHALAHIEFNAINLALDAVYRFRDLPDAFYGDWLQVAAEEAIHFRLLRTHLQTLGHDYGDFLAHDGLWDMARRTAGDLGARMALVPRLMEARGLDVTPGIQRKLRGFGDQAGAAILDIILRDEIGHVAAGNRWFRYHCEQRGLIPEVFFRQMLSQEGVPSPRPPFNAAARLAAGFSPHELAMLSDPEQGH